MKRKATTHVPKPAPEKKVKIQSMRYGLSYRGKTFIVLDTQNGNRPVTKFSPFPKTLDELKKTTLYLSQVSGLAAEKAMWTQAADGKRLNSLAGILDWAGSSIEKMTDAASYGGDTPTGKTFHHAAVDHSRALNEAYGTFGFEAGTRLSNICSCLAHGTKVPADLLVGISGCEAVATS